MRIAAFTTGPASASPASLVRAGAFAFALLVMGLPAAVADERFDQNHIWDEHWSITAFVGRFDDSRFGEVISLRGWNFEDSYLGGVALNRRVATSFDDRLHWEVDGSLYRHWGEQSHWEANAAVVARWTDFPWDDYVNTSFAFGQGLSYATRRPAVEGDDTRRFLNHLLVELETAPPGGSPVSLVTRVHHRSGAFGLYGTSAGSDFVSLGLRYRF